MTELDSAQFDGLFDGARRSVFRLEARQVYAVAREDAAYAAFRDGLPRPERSVRTSPWLARIARQVSAGVDWSRVRVVEHPLTEYTRYALLAYVESQAAGERIGIAEQPVGVAEDFWLIDPDGRHPSGVLMRYDSEGHLLRRELVTDPTAIRRLAAGRDAAWQVARPLNVFRAKVHGVAGA